MTTIIIDTLAVIVGSVAVAGAAAAFWLIGKPREPFTPGAALITVLYGIAVIIVAIEAVR